MATAPWERDRDPTAAPDGGAAFPSVGEGFGNPTYSAPGMSLRDWFAGQALAGITANDAIMGRMRSIAEMEPDASPHDEAARYAYEIADAMLAARADSTVQSSTEAP